MVIEQAPETAVRTDNCMPTTPEAFMASIQKPLGLFAQTIQDFKSLDQNTLGPQGLAATAAREYYLLLLQAGQQKDTVGITGLYVGLPKTSGIQVIGNAKGVVERYFRNGINDVIEYVDDGVETNDHPSYAKPDSIKGKAIKPEEKQKFDEVLEKLRQIRIDYSKNYASLNHSWFEQGIKVTTAFEQYAGSDFQNFVSLVKYLQETETVQGTTLVRLIDSSQHEGQDPIKKALETARLKEEAQPTYETLLSFFANIAGKYYKNGQKDDLWTGISILLGQPNEILKTAFTTPGNEQVQKALLAPIVDSVTRNGLPPTAAVRYQSYLAEQQAVGWHYIIQRGSALNERNEFKIGNNHQPEAITWTQRKKRNSRVSAQNGSSKAEETATDRTEQVKPPRQVLVGETLCQNEESIRSQLEQLMKDNKVKECRREDIDSYALIIAKIAGLRENAPGFQQEKMNVDKVKFSTGEEAPVMIIRRQTAVAPRLAVCITRDFVVLLKAWDRNDSSYSHQQRKFTFPIIEIPFLPAVETESL
jgi:hypothetical protein